MYELSDKKSAVREVQKMLRYISDTTEYALPIVSIDGIYGEETKRSVSVFQKENGLPIDGRVDYKTYLRLYAVYTEAKEERERIDYIITDQGFPIGIGVQNDDVTQIHAMIRELNKSYPELPKNLRGSYYSKETEKAIADLQKIFLYEENGILDAKTYERMLGEIAHNKRLSEKYE